MLKSGAYQKALSEAFWAAARQHTEQLLAEVLNVAQDAGGSVDKAALDWIRGRLTSHLKALTSSLEARLIDEFANLRGLRRDLVPRAIGKPDLLRELTIGLARVRAGAPSSTFHRWF